MSTPRLHLFSDILATAAIGTSIVSWQEQLDWGLRILASVIAISAGAVALWQRLRKQKARAIDEV